MAMTSTSTPTEERKDGKAASKAEKEIPTKKKATVKFAATPRLHEESATKVHIGKADWMTVLGIPAACLICGLLFCYGLSDIGKDGKQGDPLAKLQDIIARKAKLSFDRRGGKTAPDCTLFFAKSTIPGAGHGIYAGRDYEEGETVLFPATEFLPASLDSQDDNPLLIQQFAFLLKHHHLVSNLEGRAFAPLGSIAEGDTISPIDYQLRASKPIKAGDELFLPFSQHPKSQLGEMSRLFANIPSPDDYAIAEEIIHDEVERFKYRRSTLGAQQEKPRDVERTLVLISKTIGRLNAKVSILLPTKKRDLDVWAKKSGNETFALAVLENKSVAGLEIGAKCLSYAKSDPQSSGIVATRQFNEGSVVIPAPLLLLSPASTRDESCHPDSETGQCTAQHVGYGSATSRCLSHKNLPFLLCPLSQADRIRIVDTNASDEEQAPNVEYMWSTRSSQNDKGHKLSADEVAKVFPTQLLLDVVALRDIEEGEQLVIKLGPGLWGTSASIPDDLIPEAWKVAAA